MAKKHWQRNSFDTTFPYEREQQSEINQICHICLLYLHFLKRSEKPC